jgi:hypothetical protein
MALSIPLSFKMISSAKFNFKTSMRFSQLSNQTFYAPLSELVLREQNTDFPVFVFLND